MPQGKLVTGKQNLSLQRQKQSLSSWKETSWCSVNNLYGFSSSLMREIQDNLELCRSYLSWESNHFINVCLKTRGHGNEEPLFPVLRRLPDLPWGRPLPHLCAQWKTYPWGSPRAAILPSAVPGTGGWLSSLVFSTLVKLYFSNMKMKNVLSWK